MDIKSFIHNRSQFPPDKLAQYAGKHIAWSPDGRSIVACDQDWATLIALVRASGYDLAECVLSSVPAHDAMIGGGGHCP